ncbi:MAG: cation:proton antiporter [Alkalibacterium sp.]|uniref:Sodium/proton antiporter, CPA1 family (TC 2.A.36) n=2 Tax=Alkalibacterium gilvum TaxID=1130080 RepID=A0A1H6TFM6_9LACT|nr:MULTISPECIES: cation:proton antiporter [Alkalibacterium]MDN6193640.1 cation:proton antiporter [Alkalibacterium sp.]MDN6293272.1 cation:proton antiporter [Alkalibacterium sp.]MDN6295034.1 cation:proton antiporter [Alkalibacterium sp.]MDN6385646.1 cation:proton antiporter [Alkalibacterium sp.]MDN6397533.1 cation:proton antiporter [Alkalibacterium sp.]
MLIGLGLLLLTGYIGGKVVSSVGLPPLIGMLTVGVLMGPYVLNILDSDLLLVSQDIRTFALIIILLRAGLGIKKEQIRKVGVIALKMSIIPCILEGFTVMGLAYYLLGFSFSEAGMLGFIIAAVSPAVVVPSMIDLKEKRYGEDKQIPTLLLTGTSIDDVIAITFFTFFVGLETQTGHTSLVKNLLSIPFNILVGILLGAVIAYVFVYIFNKRSKNHSEKLVLLLSLTIIFVKWGDYTGIASLLGVMTIGFLLLEKVPTQAQTFSTALNGLWFFLQILLFALVGSEVDITKALDAGLSGVLIIIIGLLARSLGVWLVTMNSGLDIKERLFCMIAYTPKATVQAAIGAMPLALGVQQGTTILALAVMSIILTAPLGALGIYKSAPHLLNKMK